MGLDVIFHNNDSYKLTLSISYISILLISLVVEEDLFEAYEMPKGIFKLIYFIVRGSSMAIINLSDFLL